MTHVRLEDASGYWTIVPLSHLTFDQARHGYVLSGNAWARFPFLRTGTLDPDGHAVLRAERPCVGPKPNTNRMLDHIYKPDGWQAPT